MSNSVSNKENAFVFGKTIIEMNNAISYPLDEKDFPMLQMKLIKKEETIRLELKSIQEPEE